jgi:hypothetical protein
VSGLQRLNEVPSWQAGVRDQEDVKLVIYNLKGQKIKQYSIANLQYSISSNQYSVNWNGTDQRNKPLPAGLYFGVIRSDDGILASRKMMLLK